MGCSCGKKVLVTQPKKVVRTSPNNDTDPKRINRTTRRIIRRAAR